MYLCLQVLYRGAPEPSWELEVRAPGGASYLISGTATTQKVYLYAAPDPEVREVIARSPSGTSNPLLVDSREYWRFPWHQHENCTVRVDGQDAGYIDEVGKTTCFVSHIFELD